MKRIFTAFLLVLAILLASCNSDGATTGVGSATDEATSSIETESFGDGSTETESSEDDSAETESNEDDSTETESGEDDSTETESGEDDSTETESSEDDSTETESSEDDSAETESNEDDSTETESTNNDEDDAEHTDSDNNGYCDDCGTYVIVTVDFYSINDLHGKIEDTDSQPGVDELTSYLKSRMDIDDYTVFLSAGDMWQGGTASNGTQGRIVTEWMNHLGFVSMTLGNHEFDWGQDAIRTNAAIAEFPILAINVYDNSTGQRFDYCEPSIMIRRGGANIGIIGAIGDCYDSISSEMTSGISFKTGSELTALVKAESQRLRAAGADIIVYVIHDGTTYSSLNATDYYDLSLSSGGYVDVVFGAHTHSYYIFDDVYGVSHLQGGGDNSKGMTHVEVNINYANGNLVFTEADYVQHSDCADLEDDPIVEELLDKYWSEISWMYENLGYNSVYRGSSYISNLAAELYYKAGVEKWGDEYDIVLAGGSIKTRSPYDLPAGYVQYGDLQTILPFDNALYLCSIKGSDLIDKFLNNTSYSKYSTITVAQVNRNATYYIIADSWTALYAWAKCTPIELYDETTFARDLIAKYIAEGGLS